MDLEKLKSDLAPVATSWGKKPDKAGWCPHCDEQPRNIENGVCGWCGGAVPLKSDVAAS